MHVTVIGGGWTPAARDHVYGPFLERAGSNPTVACVVVDEGDGAEQFERWATALGATAACRPEPVLVPLGATLDTGALGDAAALLVCGGLTPAYADSLAPVATDIRGWLDAADRPYCGFSAGAAVAATRAVVGGHRYSGVAVCPEDAGEDLDEVTVVDGLGLVPLAVDVHAAQWGTLGRAVIAVRSGMVPLAAAIDEDTALVVDDDGAIVTGLGNLHLVRPAGESVHVRRHAPGDRIALG